MWMCSLKSKFVCTSKMYLLGIFWENPLKTYFYRLTTPAVPTRLSSWSSQTLLTTKAWCSTWASSSMRRTTWAPWPASTPPGSTSPHPTCSPCWFPRGPWTTPWAVTCSSTWTRRSPRPRRRPPPPWGRSEITPATERVLSRHCVKKDSVVPLIP